MRLDLVGALVTVRSDSEAVPQTILDYMTARRRKQCDGLLLFHRHLLSGLLDDLNYLEERIAGLDVEISGVADTDPMAVRLQQLRGVGPLIETAFIATVGNVGQFTKGRQIAASLGLTPGQFSSGGKDRPLGISKRGDAYLRPILIHGARLTIVHAEHRDDRLSVWVTDLAKRRHINVAAVALANRTPRVAWAIMKRGTDYDPERAAARAMFTSGK